MFVIRRWPHPWGKWCYCFHRGTSSVGIQRHGLDNAVIELDSFEVPIMDGSALPFVNMLKEVGTHLQGKAKKLLMIRKPVSVKEGESSAILLPSDEFKITYEIDFKHQSIGKQSYSMTFSDEKYEKEICAARPSAF